eukprot:CAMPEP_0205940234 /NCGR_PEP_ID=MMETSP1325-20131115/51857_1 /ASSEMBLY_ACC=CAM_ASM_000708 /TAXON_ID=236786 /ORGANISM="Florenciella sp., Strain RCC1007" /LENGTH=90 /DNA_ID=CAMNT_0053310765 /DNA_START=9 /DNA_END=277 /DNA_ORIENTATION=+
MLEAQKRRRDPAHVVSMREGAIRKCQKIVTDSAKALRVIVQARNLGNALAAKGGLDAQLSLTTGVTLLGVGAFQRSKRDLLKSWELKAAP